MAGRKPDYRAVAIGGTFDKLHVGHERLISTAFRAGKRVVIGVTTDLFVATLAKRHLIEPYSLRARNLRRFIKSRGWTSRAILAPLNDPFGPAAIRPRLEAIIVTPDTVASAKRLNKLRRSNGLPPVQIVRIQFRKAEDGKPISSTRIRKGEVDRFGRILRKR